MDASGGGDRGDQLLTQFPVRIAGETTIQTQTRTGIDWCCLWIYYINDGDSCQCFWFLVAIYS